MTEFFVSLMILFCGEFEGQAKMLCLKNMYECQLQDSKEMQLRCVEKKYSEYFRSDL